ncbi:MAG: D-alanyl-D-alanine carboxypeptidase [Anaeromicrobium sp.]|uniref:D-alanyl-D-alanine carboxypeptidase family protein n=1 Tax=Anaeromicrobium sp. TaxID=1929132 RepID=UPI0025E9DAB6|nr:D-alanyl-D-alanine carboxypeptidase family protein [Anaeromicrobium sp.]MCT4592649.1 D-alanyl-D-alanine carboxypeptidase [Anaeromicrobium sp.]
MKKITKIFFIIILIFSTTLNGFALDFQSNAKAAILTDEEGNVLYEKNGNEIYAPASITKLMTYLLTMEYRDKGLVSYDHMVTITKHASNERGSTYWLVEGEKLTLKELIDAMMVASANDATMAIAEYIGGSEEEFVKMMNDRALELGMKNTRFENPNGMPEEGMGNLMSAKDINILAKYLIRNYKDELLTLTSMKTLVNEKRRFRKDNTNKLLKVMPQVDGLKTGYTDEAGYCLVSTMPAKGFRLISVIMGTNNDYERVKESKSLLEFGDNNFKKQKVVDMERDKYTMNLFNEEKVPVEIVPKENIWRVSPHKYVKSQNIIIPENTYWKVKKGQVVGNLELELYNSERIRVDLVSNEDKTIPPGVFFRNIFTILGCAIKSAILGLTN